MIFTGIKRKSNQLFFNKNVNELATAVIESPSKKIENVLVFMDDKSMKGEVLSNVKEILGIHEKNVQALIFLQNIPKENSDLQLYSPKDFGWYGKISNDYLKNILTKKYDLLINYSKVDNLYNNLLILHSKAAFKVGFAKLDNRFYDLLINCKSNEIELFNKEVKKYLEILNKI